MARRYAQLAAIVFIALGLGGVLTGDAGRTAHGQPGGNVEGLTLHLTYLRDVIDLVIGGAFAYAGFRATEARGRSLVLGVGIVLLALAALGYGMQDDAAATRAFVTLHFPPAINAFDLSVGVLTVLCALGSFGGTARTAR